MFEIKSDELRVMGCLIHAETVETVIRETGIQSRVVIDIIRHLFHYRYIKPVSDTGKGMAMFEIDTILNVRFILSSKGYSVLEKQGQ